MRPKPTPQIAPSTSTFASLASVQAPLVQAARLHARVDEDAPRPAVFNALMKCRAANTGYVATAPPPSSLVGEHFFDLTRRSGGLRPGGRLTRRMLWIDHSQQELALIYKEEITKSYPFHSLTAVEPIDGGVRLSIGGETLVLTSTSAPEVVSLRMRLERVLAVATGPPHLSLGGPPNGRVNGWLMSGTVEKEGKLRWASRWLVLTTTRLYVLRSVASLCPLNVITLDESVRVTPGARQFTLSTRSRPFSFRTADDKLSDHWVAAITEHCVSSSVGARAAEAVESAPDPRRCGGLSRHSMIRRRRRRLMMMTMVRSLRRPQR